MNEILPANSHRVLIYCLLCSTVRNIRVTVACMISDFCVASRSDGEVGCH